MAPKWKIKYETFTIPASEQRIMYQQLTEMFLGDALNEFMSLPFTKFQWVTL